MDNNEKQKYMAIFDMLLIAIDNTNDRINRIIEDHNIMFVPDSPDITKLSDKIGEIVKDLE